MRVAYVRVSTVEQNEARQTEALQKYNIEKWYIEKVSAKDTNRPKLKEMLGHTPKEVFCGAILGVVFAFFFHYIILL